MTPKLAYRRARLAVAAVCGLLVLTACPSAQVTGAVAPLRADDVTAAERIVFCSGHPAFDIDDLRTALAERGMELDIVDGNSRAVAETQGTYYVAVDDAEVASDMRFCLTAFPGEMTEQLVEAAAQLGTPIFDPSITGLDLGPVVGTVGVLRGEDWIGSVVALASTG